MMPHLLSSYAQMLGNRERLLAALGIRTLEEFQSAAMVARPELDAFLGTSVDELLSAIPATAEAIPQSALETILAGDYALGVDLDVVPRLTVAPGIQTTDEESSGGCANLIKEMPPVRDQGNRGTCVAFASIAAYEQSLFKVGAGHDLSEQFLYWNCKANDGIPTTSGTFLGIAFPLLKRDGCCLETAWPYVSNPVIGNEGQGPPTSGSQFGALTFRLPAFRTIPASSVSDYRMELLGGHTVAFSIPVFNSWYRSPAVAYSGNLTMPIPGEVRVGGHAMCIVGCIDQPDQPQIGGGRFILRNSWGSRWGINSPHGIGYGTIPYAYVARFGVEAYSVG
jgi:hypothetical protein